LSKGHGNFVYPDLQTVKDESVSKILPTALRSTLPSGVSKPLVEETTGKSLRKGAITELAMHPQCDIFVASFRSGHALDNALQHCADRTNVGLSITGARCLAGYGDVHRRVCFARVECLGARNKVMLEKLMNHCMPSNIPNWMTGGSKCPRQEDFHGFSFAAPQVLFVGLWPNLLHHQSFEREGQRDQTCGSFFPRLQCSPEMVLKHWCPVLQLACTKGSGMNIMKSTMLC